MTTFVQISDTHFGSTRETLMRGANPFEQTRRAIAQINALPVQPDFVIHTGDLVDDADDDAAYKVAAEALADLTAPVYFVTGNHDRSAKLKQFMTFGPHTTLGDGLFYSFTVNDEQFIVLDGRGADEIDPAGVVSAEQIKYLHSLPSAGNPLSLFIHFPLFPIGSPWADEAMMLQNGQSLHEVLLPLRGRLRGVFHGHLHQSLHITRDGIAYSVAPSLLRQFQFWIPPSGEIVNHDAPAAFNWVNCMNQQTVVRPIVLQ